MAIQPNVAAPRVAAPLPTRPGVRRRFGVLDRHVWVLYVAPAALVLVAVTLAPLVYLLYNSLTDYDLRRAYLGRTFIGLGNYRTMLEDGAFWQSVQVALTVTAGVVVVELVFGMALAMLFSREFPGKRVVRSLFLLPLITTPVVVGLTWRMLYNSDLGMINYVLGSLGLPTPLWLASTRLALPSVIITDTWHAVPFVTLMFVAGLQSLPTEPQEAAKVDGASAWRRFLDITLPQMRPLIFLALIFRATDAIRMFDLIYVMTSGGPANATQTLNMYAYKVGFQFLNIGYGSALAVVLMLVCIGISFVLVKYSGIELEGGAR
ncbi:MAG: N-Acetyl-D-glucosamine ABC transport system, permease protein 1 [uncultured Thermomicrobiales bacterium]|uniref:N-Acetyl-D-glucosamine ABC transport system, permease protein 1 n=1 Tax=uncultured Thermomicrobiales bacterium TaxID=1645740 RepID=A0A6J4VCL0_9BACT|nr:MAG: N-Acetyl-D-glucosamine ABC transport system, permease protein 1 [uncultured Thermomicrobiales bacterium]